MPLHWATQHSWGQEGKSSTGGCVRPLSQLEPSSPYLIREAGGGGAAAVVGDGGGQVPQWAGHRRAGTVANTLILITALGLLKDRCPVRGTGGRGPPWAFLLPAG